MRRLVEFSFFVIFQFNFDPNVFSQDINNDSTEIESISNDTLTINKKKINNKLISFNIINLKHL